jgi:ribosomal RNA-processing protein 1
MKLKVKSHVQQERNMRGHKDKFPTPPPDLNKRDGPYKPRVPTKEDDGVNPFARQLASGDKEVRDATFAALGKWLGARADVPLLDMKKIWKGLFYAMWHADGWDVQEELAEQIAGLTHALRHKVALTYLGVFYITARREWVGIDRHRMDKYLRLVRRVTSHALRYCANRDWRADVVQDIASVFEKAALVAGTKGMVDVGLRLHISELFVGELRKVAAGKDKVTSRVRPRRPERSQRRRAPDGVSRKVFHEERTPRRQRNQQAKGASSTGIEPKTHKPSLVPSTATESFLNAFATVLQFDQHKPLHRRVLGSVFEAAAEGADGGVAQQALLSEDFEFDEDEEDGIDPKVRKEALAAATMVRLDAATMKRMSKPIHRARRGGWRRGPEPRVSVPRAHFVPQSGEARGEG